MANRFWVGSTNTWDGVTTTNWSATSGGASGASVPTVADDVFFDGSSTGTCTLSASTAFRSLNCTGFAGTISHPTATAVTVGDATAGAGNICIVFSAAMTYTKGATSSSFTLNSSSATQQTIDGQGKSLGNITLQNGGSYLLTSTFNSTGTINLARAALDTNNQTCTWAFFSSSNSSVRSMTLGSSSIILNGGSGTHWDIATATNMTFTCGTSTLTFTYSSTATMNFGGLTYNNVIINYLMGIGITINNSSTFANLTIQGTNGTSTSQAAPAMGGNNTITGLFTATGFSSVARVSFRSTVVGTTRTITAASVSLSNVDFQDITGAGAAAPFTGTSLGDGQGNSGITFTTPVTRYAVATGNWSSTAVWSATSGGATGASFPLPQDTVFLNAASGAITVSTNMFYMCADFDCTGFTGTLGVNTARNFFGMVKLVNTMTHAPTTITLAGRGTHTVTCAGRSFAATSFSGFGGSYTFQDDYSGTAQLTHTAGILTANGFNLTSGSFVSSGSIARTINMGSGTWTISGTGTPWNLLTTTGLTFNANTSTLLFTSNTAVTNTVNMGNQTYNNIMLTGGGSGVFTFLNGSGFTANNFTVSNGATTLTFKSGDTTVFNGTVALVGSAGNLITINSTSAGTKANLSKTSGTVSADYLSLQDSNATGGAAWYAGANSTNVSNNSGWIFTAPPSSGQRNQNLALMGIG